MRFVAAPGEHAAPRRTGRRTESGARAGRPVRSLAAAVFALALPLGALLPSATLADVLVSNLGEGDRSTASVGSSVGGRFTQAIGFETGSNTSGYNLTSIRAALSNALPADGVRVSLYDAQFAFPGSSLFTFDNPTISDGTKTFTAPANTTLQKDRLYFLLFDSSVADAGYRVGTTGSGSLTSAVAGWKLNASLHFRIGTDGTWLVNPNAVALRVEINGTVKPNATGKPGITGVPQVGESLTATVGDITDADGLPAFLSGFTFQWVRVDGTTETDILGATSSTYEPVEADVGKHLKVKVSYTDNTDAAEGPLESEPTDDAVLAARVPCPSRSDWCAGMTVRHGTGTSVPLQLGGGTDGSFGDNSFEYGTRSYVVNAIWLLTDPLSGTNAVAVTLDAFVPRGSVFHIGGAMFTADGSSEQANPGQYLWPAPSGLSWIEGQKVTASVRFRRPSVTIVATNTEAVYRAERIGFTVTRDGDTHTDGPLDVDVVLTDGRGHLPESALSRTITIADGDSSAGFFIQPGDFEDLDDGAWTTRPGTITGKVMKRPGYKLGSPSSVDVKMNYATTVGFGPFTSNFRVDEGSGSVDVTFYATTGAGMGAPTQRVEVQYTTVAGSAIAPGDFRARSGSVFIEPSDFECIPGGYDGCDLARDGHRATKIVTLTNIIINDSIVEGDETFRLLLHKGASNPESVVYVDDRGVRGVTCTPGSTCAAEITIVDNDGITEPTEHPDWTLTGSTRIFSGTSSAHRQPLISGTETATRCLNGSRPFRLTDHNGNPVTGDITYSLHVADGYAGYPGLTQRWAVPGMFSIDDTGQIRTKVGADYPNTESPAGNLRTIYANVRATHTESMRYAEYRQGFIILHPTATHFDDRNPECDEEPRSPQAPLTGQVQNAPDSHDGSTAFSFRIVFSEDVDIEPDELRDDAIKVSHATVTAAARVDERDDLWELTLTPNATQAISIQLRGQLECSQDAAICTADGKKLAANVTHSVPYAAPGTRSTRAPADPPGLTATFENAPASHDGARTFTVELAFSEAVFDGSESFDKNQAIQDALQVTGGTVGSRRRADPGSFDRWIFGIRPSGHGDVTLSLPATTGGCSAANAICTPDGTPLSGDTTATIEGPELPELSIADTEVQEAPGAKLVFAITLSHAATETVSFDIATSDGSALAGEDYETKSKTKTFAPGETSKVFRVKVIDDALDEGDETLTVTISNVTGATLVGGTASGTIENSDPMPQAWLARFGRTVADQVIDAVEGRMEAARAPGTEVNLAGQRLGAAGTPEEVEAHEAEAGLERLTEWLRGAGGKKETTALTSRSVTGRELLSGSSFALTAGSAESGFGALWGRGAVSRFDGREGDLTLDGEVASALLGADFSLGRGTAGLVVAHSLGEGGYRSPNGEGEVESTLTGLYPWSRYAASERLSLWGLAGYGAGTLTLTPDGQAPMETDMALTMAALGGRGVLAEAPAEGGLELSVTSDALVVRTTSDEVRGNAGNLAASEADVTRLRLGLEGTWRGLGTLVPTLEVGARHDGGDAETGLGADIGGRLVWDDPSLGVRAELAARGLLTHEDGSLSERGLAGSLAWDPSPDTERGAKLTLRQAVGAEATGGMDALLRPETARVLEAANDDGPDRRTLKARFGYGIALFGGGWTGVPEVGLGLTETGREYIHAWRLLEARDAGLVFGLDVEGVWNERLDGDVPPEHRVGLGFGWELVGARREDLKLRFEASRLLPANDGPESRIGVRLTARW